MHQYIYFTLLKSQAPLMFLWWQTYARCNVSLYLEHSSWKNELSFLEQPCLGTRCVNSTFSRQLGEWLKANWSYSTAFYPGESPFSSVFASRVNRSMGLNPENGGKFQITSYPTGKGRFEVNRKVNSHCLQRFIQPACHLSPNPLRVWTCQNVCVSTCCFIVCNHIW